MAMELDNSFTVPVPPETAWDVLLDVARIAPCMPGATVDEVDGDVVNGRIKVKVGPVSLTYKGTATFTGRDAEARTVTLEAAGKETRGAGTASATVQASLAPAEGGATTVSMHTTMNVTGRPAQFGRGVMVEVGGKLVDQFAHNLAQQLAAESAAPAGSAPGAAPSVTAAAGAASASAGSAGAGSAGAGSAGAGSAGDAEAGGAAGSGEAGSGVAGSGVAAEGGAGQGEATTAAAGVPVVGTADAGDSSAAGADAAVAAPEHEESLNLIRLVGPAILKRVIPVAAAGAAIALLTRRIRRVLRGRKQG